MTALEDNEGTEKLAQNLVTNSSSKHIRVRHRFLKGMVGRRTISTARSTYGRDDNTPISRRDNRARRHSSFSAPLS